MDKQYQRAAPPKILRSYGANFVSKCDERQRSQQPAMMLTAWTQTTGEDFDLLHRIDSNMEAENRALREKVRYLESKLQQHTELLSQIHATSARMQQVTTAAAAQTLYDHTNTSPPTPPAHHQILTPPSSVICAPVQPATQRAEVIDYKIVAAAGADVSDADAIEIRLAAESLNSLSTSADSDRLEICLSDEAQQPTQHDIKIEPTPLEDSALPPMQVMKRRKLEMQDIKNVTAPLQQQQHRTVTYKLPSRRSTGNVDKNAKVKHEADGVGKSQSEVLVSIGPNNTCVPVSMFDNINWSSSSLATRKLLVTIFDRETLATHSMTGKPSPAFRDQQKPQKQMLDPLKIQDIIFAVTRKCSASEKEVRNAITTKCADENKMMKIQKVKQERRSLGADMDKENMIHM